MKAFLKNYRQSPRKVRLVADLIRHKDIKTARSLLSATPRRAALPMRKLLDSAVSNAIQGKKFTEGYLEGRSGRLSNYFSDIYGCSSIFIVALLHKS